MVPSLKELRATAPDITSSSLPLYYIHLSLVVYNCVLVTNSGLGSGSTAPNIWDRVSQLQPIFSMCKTYGLHHNTGNPVRVGVGGRSSVLEVTVTLLAALTGNTDGSTTVGNTVGKLIDSTGLVTSGKTEVVVLTIYGDVLHVATLELLDGSLDVLHATLLAHLLGGEVAVQTGTVPVTGTGLGVEGDLSAELFGDSVEEETSDPEVVTHLDTEAGTDLELPLGGHDLGVGTGDLDAGVQARLVVSLDDVTAVDLAGTHTAVVWALGTGETVDGPAIWSIRHIEESVFLLETEPWLVVLVRLHELGALVAVVELVGGSIGIPALGHDQDIGGATEGIGEDSAGAEVDI
jgi:hypothetical protein